LITFYTYFLDAITHSFLQKLGLILRWTSVSYFCQERKSWLTTWPQQVGRKKFAVLKAAVFG
jgi:hypothetical protein